MRGAEGHFLHQRLGGAGSGQLDDGQLLPFAANHQIFHLEIALAAAAFGGHQQHPAEAPVNLLIGDVVDPQQLPEKEMVLSQADDADFPALPELRRQRVFLRGRRL